MKKIAKRIFFPIWFSRSVTRGLFYIDCYMGFSKFTTYTFHFYPSQEEIKDAKKGMLNDATKAREFI